MKPTWSFQGTAGAGWDATARTQQTLRVKSGTLRTGSLDQDGCDLSLAHPSKDFSGLLLPDEGQVVSVLRDGTKVFVGEVGPVRLSVSTAGAQAAFSIRGPWDRMARTRFAINTPGGTGIYPTSKEGRYVLSLSAAQKADVLYESIIGCAAGDSTFPAAMAPTFTGLGFSDLTDDTWIMHRSVESMTYAQVLADVLGSEPGDLAWWDYSGSTPAFCVSRGSARWPSTTLTVGTDTGDPSFLPRTDIRWSGGFTLAEKYLLTEGDTFATGGTGTLGYSRPGVSSSFTKAAGDTNWFSWTSGAGDHIDLRARYAAPADLAAFFSTGQTGRPVGIYGPSAAVVSLYDRRDWLPYEGRAGVVRASPASTLFGGRRILVSGGHASWASMLAPVRLQEIDLMTGRETVTTGPTYGYQLPTALWDLAAKFRF